MTTTQPHPRRCYKTRGHPTFASFQPTSTIDACLPDRSADSNLPLRKSATFHSPKSLPSDDDPILSIPLLSRRSPTSHKDLEDAVAAGEQRIAQLLGSVDRSLSGLESFSSDSQETLRQEETPVPRFMLGPYTNESDRMDVDDSFDVHTAPPKVPQRADHNRHTSDSGLGSSISSTEESLLGEHAGMRYSYYPTSMTPTKAHPNTVHILTDYKNVASSTITEIRSGINGSTAEAHARTQNLLSKYACKQIQDHIIIPILKEKHLQPFHQLIKTIPYRVSRKDITCLRDLEKVILWLAPVSGSYYVWARSLAHRLGSGVKKYCDLSGSSFLKFAETSIQCLHTTVDHLPNESDKQRPSDRPYTNGYFLDLTAQVRQYAAMINETRARLAAGRASGNNDYIPYDSNPNHEKSTLIDPSGERLSLRGGLGKTGYPAELVRIKDGQAISLRTGQVIQPDAERRSSSNDEDLEMSMARRKKSEQAAVKQSQRCSECDKEFKRPCDLTKHEKTHSRPWKCNEPSCKYSQYGWPTEKERDRHVNDKHSVTPNMYKCQYHPCPYESKRESNCKQHMEKAHGWAYVRSKNNGKIGNKKVPRNGSGKTPPTPQMTTPGSNIFDNGSEFGESTSPYMHSGYGAPSIGGSTRASTSPYMTQNGYLTHSRNVSSGEGSRTSESPYLGMSENFGPYNDTYGWDESFNRLTPQTSYTPDSHRHSIDSFTNTATIPSTYDMQADPPLFGGDVDWSNMDFTSMNITLDNITPLSSIETRPLDAYSSRNPSISVEHPKNPNLSPGAQGNQMLYTPSPYSNDVDEGYSEFTTNVGKAGGDFELFGDSHPTSSMGPSNMSLFSDLPPFQPTTWSGRGTDLAQQLGINDMQLEED